jgi:glycosidase
MPRVVSRFGKKPALVGVVAALVAALPAGGATDVVAQSHEVPPAPAGAALTVLAKPPLRSSIALQRIYFVMTDRYANGNPDNDRGGRNGTRGVTGFDPADTGWFHGGDFRGLTGECTTGTGLARIKALGFTAVWVTPPFGQKAVQGSSAAYHGYWIRDFTSVDPHLGSEQDFAGFVTCAHQLGLKVYLDVVVNHTADVIVPTGSGYSTTPYRDCRGKLFDPARYAGGRLFPCLKASNFPRVPVLLPEDRTAKKPAWLNDVRRYHNRGDIDFSSCSEACYEQGDFFGLDDLFTEQPTVVDGLAQIYGDWISRYKIDGFRIDTARHVDRAFFEVWIPKIRAAARAAGVRDFELFGEVFVSDAIELSSFVRERKLPNVLDFPFQDAATRFAAGDASAKGIVARLDDDDYYQGANGVAHTPPTFLGNHDMGRAARMIKDRSGGKTGAELLRRVLLGHSLMYLFRGAPVVYYGDEVGIVGAGGDKEARQDLFRTQVPGWRSEERVGSGPIGVGSSLELASHPVASHLRALAALREAHPALSTGATVVRQAAGSVLAFSRIDAAGRREYLAAFNAGTSPARVTLRTGTPSSAWAPLLGNLRVTSTATGDLTLTIPATGAVLLRAEKQIPVAKPVAPTVKIANDDLTELVRISATPGGSRTVSVAFAVKRARSGWRRLAADDSFPYRAFLEPGDYRRSEAVHIVAIARSLDGSLAVSPVTPLVARR